LNLHDPSFRYNLGLTMSTCIVSRHNKSPFRGAFVFLNIYKKATYKVAFWT